MDETEVNKSMGKMWGEEKNHYALVKRKDSFYSYTIMDTLYNNMILIEVDDIAQYVIKKMLENGVRVVDDFEQVRNLNRPDPVFYTPELEAQYRKMQEQQKNKTQ
jgi:hypothetical protein